jgi:predicted nucleotidyltransferase
LKYVPKLGTIVPEMSTTTEGSNISSTLFGKTRQAVLALLFMHADDALYLRQLVRITGIGIGALQWELKELTAGGIIKRLVRGRQVYYQVNKECPIFNDLKNIVIKTVGAGDVLRAALTPLIDHIDVAFIYGSFAAGKESQGSDVDVFIVGDVTFDEVVFALNEAQSKIGREVNPSVYPVKEFKTKLAKNHHFLKTVLGRPMIFLIGDKGELERLAQ